MHIPSNHYKAIPKNDLNRLMRLPLNHPYTILKNDRKKHQKH